MNICFNISNQSDTIYDSPVFSPEAARFSTTDPLPDKLQPFHSYSAIAVAADGISEFWLQYKVSGQTGTIKLGIKKQNQTYIAECKSDSIQASQDSAISWTFVIGESMG